MKALILSCGGSPEPLIFCIENFNPDFTYFLCSNDSIGIAQDIAIVSGLSEDQFKLKIVQNHESLEDAFAKSREIILELRKEYDEIHVDFTGGTKPMVSGLVLAAIGEECTYSYVGTENLAGRDKNGLGIVQTGFEKIKDQRDPYDVFAVMEFNRGMDFFNKYQFEAAKTNFMKAIEKLESENLKELVEIYLEIVNVYDLWDKFKNVGEEKKTLNSILSKILDEINSSQYVKEYLNENYPEFIPQIQENIEFLKLKISRRGVLKLTDVPYYLPDLLNNSYRRMEEGKYDDAVARLYRCIELIAQVTLTEEKIIDENILKSNAEFKINKNDLKAKYNADADFLVQDWNEYVNSGKTFGVGLKKSYELLSALGSQYAKNYLADEDIKNNLSSRNRSILAHGLQPIDNEKAEKLYSQVVTYAKRAFPDLIKYMDMAEFPKFE